MIHPARNSPQTGNKQQTNKETTQQQQQQVSSRIRSMRGGETGNSDDVKEPLGKYWKEKRKGRNFSLSLPPPPSQSFRDRRHF